MANDRIARAIAYVEGNGSDLAPLETMGLNAAEIHEVLALARWNGRTAQLRAELEQLHDRRVSDEVSAGLRFPIVVVAPPERRKFPRAGVAGLVVFLILGTVVAVRVVRGARPEQAPAVPEAASATAPPAGAVKTVEKKPSASRKRSPTRGKPSR